MPIFKFVISILAEVIAWITENWPLIQKTISIVLNAVWDIIKGVLTVIQDFWKTWGQTIIDYATVVFNNIKIVISTVIKVIQDIIKAVMLAINGDWSGALNALVQAVKAILGGLGALISNILGGIGKIFGDLANIAIKWGEGLIDGFINGIKNKVKAITDTVSDVVKGISNFLGFHSPAKEGEGQHIVEWGANMITGFMGGIKSQLPNLQKLMSNVIQSPSLSANVNLTGSGTNNSGSVTQNVNIGNMNLMSKGDQNRSLQQLRFLAPQIN
jgi:phage-related protein